MKSNLGQLRIIAGRWRGRKLPILAVDGLRPTSDRIRETLFNWLSERCHGSHVLDCFSGSGALGFEASSRRARQVTMVEKDQRAWQNLKVQQQRLNADSIELYHADILESIPGLQYQYDIVFIDPPYAASGLRTQVIERLIAHACLNDGALLYLEWPQGEWMDLASAELSLWRYKKAGQVHYALAQWQQKR